ncbi:MAG: hypothetical protein COA73_00635 [Candidatus Hydrogenedentota bacterium]|nr:MAG: hypothetical protein COA73_00635 [Candidatus Hydrogenedentota bacterium]
MIIDEEGVRNPSLSDYWESRKPCAITYDLAKDSSLLWKFVSLFLKNISLLAGNSGENQFDTFLNTTIFQSLHQKCDL